MLIHRNPGVLYNTIFGKLTVLSPYLWLPGRSSKPLIDDMLIQHNGRSETVERALADFGIEESFANAAIRFKEHYHYDIGPSAVARSTKNTAQQAMDFLDIKFSNSDDGAEVTGLNKMLLELDGCEIRTAEFVPSVNTKETTPVHKIPKKEKLINWRDVRLGFVRPLDSKSKIFAGGLGSYSNVVSQMHDAAVLIGMTQETEIVGIADGGIGLSEELKKQFPTMQFILDKTHLKDHLYATSESIGIKKKLRAAWVEHRLQKISNGDVDAVLEDLKGDNTKKPHQRLTRLIGYIERFKHSLDYHHYKTKDYPIGSGEIESAHKSIPQKRLKLPGASWLSESINPMLSLRILRANGWWDEFWECRTYDLAA